MTIRETIKNTIKEQNELRKSMTDKAWVEHCTKDLFNILEEHKDVFIRLKNR